MDERMRMLESCSLCPRRCGVNRLAGEKGFCGAAGEKIRVARAALHQWEEPCISGERGSGTVFFSYCTLRCGFCQNREIRGGEAGADITVERLAEIFLEQQARGAHNINLVTPTHYIPQIMIALDMARKEGLTLPVVYNTSGYERAEVLRLLEGYVDIWLPDFKYMDETLGRRFSAVPDYPENALSALCEMYRQSGEPVFDADGMMQKGMIIRHLILPGHMDNSKDAVEALLDRFGNKVWYSLMNQYTPPSDRKLPWPELERKLTEGEYDEIVGFAEMLGMENAFTQEDGTAEESFIPAFDLEGVLHP